MFAYAIKNKKDGKFVFGFDYRTNALKPRMRYISNDENGNYKVPKLLSKFEAGLINSNKRLPKYCELVKVEIKEVKE
ncbi:hypothetical protein [Thomasclavelia sp.]|uniref:hypothetical protein n=1 Tax=Thomasclavelia sp. TaxID=3025757 RepID=UPI0025E1C20E|nr:hypothetical protein [Thomasclavelia sp.]